MQCMNDPFTPAMSGVRIVPLFGDAAITPYPPLPSVITRDTPLNCMGYFLFS